MLVILSVANTMIHETRLPYFKRKLKFPFGAIGETTLNELQSLLQWNIRSRSYQQMEMIGHDHKFMQQKSPLSTVLRKHIEQKLSHPIRLQKRAASDCRRAHEERTCRLGSLEHTHQG